ncbi:MAG: YaeQ family protein [Caldimonas sp.]
MAQKATICKAALQIADIDRGIYADHQLTLARHPSENDERMMIRLLAFALNVPASNEGGALEFAKGMWDPDEPELWQKDLTGRLLHWIEVGQPEEKRLVKASGKADRVSVYAFSHGAPAWWASLSGRLARTRNVEAWLVPSEQSRALAGLAGRGMHLQVNRQDGAVWVADGEHGVEVVPVRLV